MNEVPKTHEISLKQTGFITPAASVLHTGHAVLRRNPHTSGAILSGGVHLLSGHLSSDLRGMGYRYHSFC